ncbi:uncharacterized protein [Chelonus insularis]|nr:uncharacterized protein LOC118069789 isoform X2 [Chelonus insularis]
MRRYIKLVNNEQKLNNGPNQQFLEGNHNLLVQGDNQNVVSVNTYPEASYSGLASRPLSFINVRDTSFSTLPPLTFDLNEKIKRKGILASQKDLIYHWGCYLWENTEGRPKRQDYQNLASTIVRTYPVLASTDGDSVIIRKSLSTWIRNHRATLKNQAAKRDHEGRIVNSSSDTDLVRKDEDQYDVEQSLEDFVKYSQCLAFSDNYCQNPTTHYHDSCEDVRTAYTGSVDNEHEFSDEQNEHFLEEKHDIQVQEDHKNIISVDVHPEPDCSELSSRSPSFMNVRDTSFSTLPPLTFDLHEKIKKKGVLASQKDLIYHWGCYLWENTEGSPKRQDYQRLASTIVRMYPVLGSSEGDSVIIRKSLSTWIRNHRAILKNQAKKSHKRRIVNFPSNVRKEEDQYDIEQALKELAEKQKEGDSPHIRHILKITLAIRRTWIKKSAKSITEIIRKYPLLANSELVIFEFCNLKHLTEEVLSNNIDKMFDKLTTFFNTGKTDDKTKACCLQLLYDRVTTIKKTIKPLITIEEVYSSSKNLIAVEGESPRSVIYTNEDDIETAYIVADPEINMKIEKPSIKKIIMVLLAAYYVWDVTYPKPYRNILEYLDHEVIGTPIDRKNVVLLKFIRQRDSEEQNIKNVV